MKYVSFSFSIVPGLQAGCCCEFSCNLLYDSLAMVLVVMWMVTVSWWVFRHWIGPQTLRAVLGTDFMDNFRRALGDKDPIHSVSLAFLYTDKLVDNGNA